MYSWPYAHLAYQDKNINTSTRIIHVSLPSGTFPDDLQKAVITLVLKKPSLNKEELKSYHTVANLPFTSKCAAQVIQHVENNYNLSTPMQSACRPCHSTETAGKKMHAPSGLKFLAHFENSTFFSQYEK